MGPSAVTVEARIMGRSFPVCQGALSPGLGKYFPMTPKRPLTRQTIANNLARLIEATGVTAPEVARRAGVDRKTVNNWLNGRYEPRGDLAELVAKVFGLGNFNLLDPNLDLRRTRDAELRILFENYEKADEKGRDNILRVAEMAARQSNKGE